MMLDVKKAIKHLMLDKNIKVGEMADSLGMKPQALSNWLYRSDVPRINTVEEVLNLLGCRLAIIDSETKEILF